MTQIGIFVSCLVILATLAPFLPTGAWWIRILEFPLIQLASLGIAAILMLLCCSPYRASLRGKTLIVLVALCVLYQGYTVAPYTRLFSPQSLQSQLTDAQASLSVLIANVQQDNRQSDRLLAIVKEASPDILCTLETDEWWVRRLDVLRQAYPYTLSHPLDNTYGIALFSRLKLQAAQINFFVESDIPSTFALVELRSGALVNLYCLHPRPPVPLPETTQGDADTEERDAELLLVAKIVQAAQEPHIVVGDLNDVAWSQTNALFQEISGLLDPRVGRGFYNTHHAKIPFLRYPVDHIFHSPSFRLIELRRLPQFGSDHFPIFAALSYEPDGAEAQQLPEPSPKEQKKAEEKIKQGKGENSSSRSREIP